MPNTRACCRLFPGVYRHATLPVESEHVVWLGIGALHSRGSDRHSPHGQPNDRWLFFQQPGNRIHRNVAFDYVALQERYVTLPKLRGYAVLRVYRIQLRVRNIIFFDLEAILLQVTYPLGAAPSRRAFVHGNVGARRNLLSQDGRRQHQQQCRRSGGPRFPKAFKGHLCTPFH